jgi:hypothetical protein
MAQTLRRQLKQIFTRILEEHLVAYPGDVAGQLADAALAVKGMTPACKRGDLVDGMLFFQGEGEKQQSKCQDVRDRLSELLSLNFPIPGENHDFDRLYANIVKDGRSVDRFCRWALEQPKKDITWYVRKATILWGDWPQAFVETNAAIFYPPKFIPPKDEKTYVPNPNPEPRTAKSITNGS